MENTSSTIPSIKINETEIQPINYENQRVVTFAMIDKVHGRATGTASRNFKTNRDKLIQGEDYFHLSQQVMKSLDEFRPTANPNGIFVLTESGYLLLVKSFTDDLAWQVQRQLVRSYFKAKPEAVVLPLPETLTSTEQYALTSAVKSKAAGNGKAIPEIWGRVKNRFRVAKYDQITRDRFQEALEYINGIEVRTLQPKAPEAPVELLLEVERLKTKNECLEAENSRLYNHMEKSDATFVALCREVYAHARMARC